MIDEKFLDALMATDTIEYRGEKCHIEYIGEDNRNYNLQRITSLDGCEIRVLYDSDISMATERKDGGWQVGWEVIRILPSSRASFKCKDCDGHRLEEVMVDVCVTSNVNDIHIEDGEINLTYGAQSNEGGEIECYQCLDCGELIATTQENLIEYLTST